MANPFPLSLEESLSDFELIQPSVCTVYEGMVPPPFQEPPAHPTTHIRFDQQWGVHFHWHTDGALNNLMSGKWHLTVYLEQMGGGEFYLPNNTREVDFQDFVDFGGDNYHYFDSFNWQPGTVIDPGAYRVVTTFDMTGPTGFHGPISALGEGPIIRFYEVGP